MTRFSFFILFISISFLHCMAPENKNAKPPITLITLDPGHFHAALVQKSMYPDVDSNVYVYSNAGADLDLHLERIKNYNTRADNPTHWNEIVYTGTDFFDKMIAEKKGNVLVLSGNNKIKADYIYSSLAAGLHVFADKPMIIQYSDFDKLKRAFELAKQKNVQLYDIMTERYEITTQLQKAFSQNEEVFGKLIDGTPGNPAVTKESVHHFYKFVSGNVLVRPAWFMDTKQQGEGLVDVQTHLVDLAQWECFPDQIIDTQNIKINVAKRWPTKMSLAQFNTITQLNGFPDYMKEHVESDTILNVYSNGEINYTLNGKHIKTSVIWNYQAPEGSGDTHRSLMQGTKTNLLIQQTKEENFKPTLYITPTVSDGNNASIGDAINQQLLSLAKEWPGLTAEYKDGRWKILVPENLAEGHEAHFGRVMEKYLSYLKNNDMPAWEVPNMISKYYTTTKALEMALMNK